MNTWLKNLYSKYKQKTKTVYRVAQFHNQLTNEIYFFIEKRGWGTLFMWRTEIIKTELYQQKFGCDKDGMFNKIDNVEHILKFLRGELKLVKTIKAL